MVARKLMGTAFLVMTGIIAVLAGCSDKTFTSSWTAVPSNGNPMVYIPLDQGWRISYVLQEPETRYFDVEVTDPATVAGNQARIIRNTDRTTGEIFTFYRYCKGNAVFESRSADAPGVRILESPFIVGHSWNRYDTSTTTNTHDNDAGNSNGYNYGAGGKDWLGDNFKTKPTEPYSVMSIVGVENVDALNGHSYANCLKVTWQSGPSTYNYFWYAAGIGLVKFEQGVNTVNPGAAQTSGIMSDYQLVEY